MRLASFGSEPGAPVAVAFSGGRDSAALLHAAVAWAKTCGSRVVALHVHHGLSAHADAWERHGRSLCERWRAQGDPVQFASTRLRKRPERTESIEAWAREQRYTALARLARRHGCEVVLLAHHRRDQAETFLLQALRGAGTAGLSAMPRSVERNGVRWIRPWLHLSRDEIEAYVQSHGIEFVDDDSNDDVRFARNRLRLQVWPALEAAFPQAEVSLAMSAQWAQQALALQEEWARVDLAAIAKAGGISIESLRKLPEVRRTHALRTWLHAQVGSPVAATLIERLGRELVGEGSASWPVAGGRELRRYRGVLRVVPQAIEPAEANVFARETTISIRRAGVVRLPGWGGTLRVRRVASGGVPLPWLAHAELRERSSGAQFQAGLGRPARSVKKQFQAAGLDEAERTGPWVYSGGQLVYVPGLGIDARVIGLPGQPQVTLEWLPLLNRPAPRHRP